MIHIIFVVDVSKSMSGSKIESALETMRELSDSSHNLYSIITFANRENTICEYIRFDHELLKKINVTSGLSNINTAMSKVKQLLEKYKKPSVLLCLTDSLFSSSFLNSKIDNSLLLDKIIVSYTTTNLTQFYSKDFSVFHNDEKGLKEISSRIMERANSIEETKNNEENEEKSVNVSETSEEEDLNFDKDDPKWN